MKQKRKHKDIEEEIEIIDIDKEEKEKEKQNIKIKKKVKLKKGLLFQTLFCLVSIIFILGCCIFYGTRLVKYYKLYNPKDDKGNAVQLLSNKITSTSTFVYEGEGLYLTGGTYIYKGENVNNYIKYSNLIWRILKINDDKSIDIVLDSSINNLKWNSTITDYSKSDVATYLKEEFLPILNEKHLTNTIVCNDKIDDIANINCTIPDSSNYVRLLNIDEFLNSKIEDKSYISNGNNIWLSSRGTKQVWTINGTSLSYADMTNTYNIKPVVTLKNSTPYVSGTGTKKDPYVIEETKNDIQVGNRVKLGEDIWTVYSIEDDKLKLSLSTLYKNGTQTYRFDLSTNKYDPTKKSSLAKYLNETFYDSLSYKDQLLDCTWYIGEYNDSYKDIYSEKVTSKVGLSSVADLKLDGEVSNYYLLNGINTNKVYIYSDTLIESKSTLSRAIKPSICIKKATIKTGDGTLEKPYTLEG